MFSFLKNKIINDNIFIKIFSLILILLTIIYTFGENYLLFHQLVEVICATLGISISIISFTYYNRNGQGVFNFIGIGFGIVSLIGLIHMLSYINAAHYEELLNLTIIIWVVTNYLEYFILISAFYFNKKKYSLQKVFYIFFIVSIIVAIILIKAYYSLERDIDYDKRIFIIITNWLALFIFIALSIYNICRSKIIDRKGKGLLLTYVVFIFIYENIAAISFSPRTHVNLNLSFVAHVFKFLSYCTLYECLSHFLINDKFDKMKENLLHMEREMEYSNKVLKDRMILENELRIMIERSKSNYSKLINSMSEAVIIFQNNKITYINEAAIELLEVLSLIDLETINLSDFFSTLNPIEPRKKITAYEQGIYYTVFNVIDQTDTNRKYEMGFQFLDQDILLICIRDITENEKIRVLKEELENYFKQEELKRDFFNNVSHELRTPINVIYTALQLNELYLAEDDMNGIIKNNENIKKNCMRLIRTINNFIDANKISEGFVVPQISRHNLVEVVENVAQCAVKYIEKMGMTLIFDASDEEIYHYCDSEFIERIVLNILSNSVKHGREGGSIFVHVSEEADFVQIRILNDSTPIPQHEQEQIFNIFSKIQHSWNNRTEGSGLGLFITKTLTELLDGTMNLKVSDIGNDFIFKFKKLKNMPILNISSYDHSINEIQEKVDIEFSDIYF